jgi:hypothetical protein
MDILSLKARKLSPAILAFLAKRRLIRPLVPTRNVVQCRSSRGTVGTIYISQKACGTHKLICVRSATGGMRLNSHQDNEEFILISPDAAAFSPLYMIIGLHKHAVIERKARSKTLKGSDFMALELVYNDPRVSIFTMLKNTPHFEFGAGGRKQAPIFFVAEPSRLKLRVLDLHEYRLAIQGNVCSKK